MRTKLIPGFGGKYKVSDTGRVWSRTPIGIDNGRIVPWRELKQSCAGTHGYLQVGLTKNRRLKVYTVHRLVLEAFVGPCPPKMECRHLDGNKFNNNLSNLKWGTRSENIRDRALHG